MRQILAIGLSLLFCFSAFAELDGKTEPKIENVDLTGMKIIETTSQQDVFGLEMQKTRYATLEDLKAVVRVYHGQPISNWFALLHPPYQSFRNVIAFIGQTDGKTQLLTLFISKEATQVFAYDVLQVENEKILVTDGSKNYFVVATQLFPGAFTPVRPVH
jgi:hypothetical protein